MPTTVAGVNAYFWISDFAPSSDFRKELFAPIKAEKISVRARRAGPMALLSMIFVHNEVFEADLKAIGLDVRISLTAEKSSFGERICNLASARSNGFTFVGAGTGATAISVAPSVASRNCWPDCAIAPSTQSPTRPSIAMNPAATGNCNNPRTRTPPLAGYSAGLHGPISSPRARQSIQ